MKYLKYKKTRRMIENHMPTQHGLDTQLVEQII